MLRFILTLFFLLPCILHAREYPVMHYTKANGLPSDMVHTVYRDSKGFIWLATDKGVVRFDGMAFQLFNTADGLTDNEVFFFQEDYDHRMWIGTYTGKLCFYKDGKFYNPSNTPFLRLPFKPAAPTNIVLEADSSLTVNYMKQHSFVNIKGNQSHVYHAPVLDSKISTIRNVFKTNDSIYTVQYNDEKWLLNVRTGQLLREPYDRFMYFRKCQGQYYAFDDRYIYSGSGKVLSPLPPGWAFTGDPNQFALTMLYNICFNGEDYCIVTENGVFINNQLVLLKGERVASVTQDITGDYWFSTLGNGVYRVSRNFKQSMELANAYTGVVTFAYSYNGIQYFATSNRRLFRLLHEKAELLFDFSEGNAPLVRMGHYTNCSASGSKIYCNGGAGTVFEWDTETNIAGSSLPVKRLFGNAALSFSKYIIATSQALYLGSSQSAEAFIPSDLNGGVFDRKEMMLNSPPGSRIYAITKDTDDRIVYSQTNGVYKYVKDTSVLQPGYGTDVFKWLRPIAGYMLGCTQTNTLYLLKDALKIDSFYDSGIIWDNAYPFGKQVLLTAGKLNYLLPLPSKEQSLLQPRIIENPFVPGNFDYFLADSGNCYFFKQGTITMLPRQELLGKPPVPVVDFLKAVSDDSIYTIGAQKEARLLLPYHSTANINLKFDILGFNAADILCEYALVQEKDTASVNWQKVINKELNLVLPAYGKIEIMVRASTLAGDFSVPRHFTIEIVKPWWARWWGVSLLVAVLVLFSGAVVFYVVKRVVKRKEKEHNTKVKMLLAEFKALNAMMNPHFIFNTINNIQGFVNSDDKRLANEYIRSFSDMVRQNMRNVSRELISLHDEIMVAEHYLKLEQLRHPQLSYTIAIDPAIDTDEVMIPPLLLQPLVENSIKHGLMPAYKQDAHVSIRILEENNTLQIQVTDNGVGLPATGSGNSGHESFALHAVKARMAAMATTHHITMHFAIQSLKQGNKVTGTQATIVMHYRS